MTMLTINSLKGTWGCIHEEKFVLPESLDFFQNEQLYGATMLCVSSDDHVVVLDFKGHHVCAKREGFDKRPTPEFLWNQQVTTQDGKTSGTIEEICWHHWEQRYYYLLKSKGKMLKRRYFADSLTAV